ncbi:MAG: MOSC domain-containing protein [Burkholderiaceae bacterium]
MPATRSASGGLRELTVQFGRPGRLEAIVLRPGRRAPADWADEALAEPGRGLRGDHRADKVRTGDQARRRELTLLQAEHLPVIASLLNRDEIDARLLRRNLVIQGLNLAALAPLFPDQTLLCRIGSEVVIEATGPCAPCSRMEAVLGSGGYNALRGHGGITGTHRARGWLRPGDTVTVLDAAVRQSRAA